MAGALRQPLARLFQRTVPATAVKGFGVALVVAGVALPWVVAGGWAAEPEAMEPVTVVAKALALRPALVHVAGGRFLMGSPPDEVGRYNDETQHPVEVSSFEICQTEVTQGQWQEVMGENPSDPDARSLRAPLAMQVHRPTAGRCCGAATARAWTPASPRVPRFAMARPQAPALGEG